MTPKTENRTLAFSVTNPSNSTKDDSKDDSKDNSRLVNADDQSETLQPWYKRIWKWCVEFYFANSFLVQVVAVILLAYAYPPLGADYLQPKITATWIAVIFIFVMAGLSLKTKEFAKAFQRVYFNAFVQIFNFGVISSLVFGFSRLMVELNALEQSLADGMVICACLPLTVNMVFVLTKSAGGDEAAAVFNAAFGNMLGVFLSPVLILGYLGVSGDVDLIEVFLKLLLRVVVPVIVGQILQKFFQAVVDFVAKYKKHFKTIQEECLVFIVYTVFCRTFENGSDSDVADVAIMIGFQFVLLCTVMGLAWLALSVLFPNKPKLRVMGLFGCSHKTVAMGVPLINAIYENDDNVGLYTLPLLIWHPMQLVIGSALAPRLAAFVAREEDRLGIKTEEAERNENAAAEGTVDEEQPGTSEERVQTLDASTPEGP